MKYLTLILILGLVLALTAPDSEARRQPTNATTPTTLTIKKLMPSMDEVTRLPLSLQVTPDGQSGSGTPPRYKYNPSYQFNYRTGRLCSDDNLYLNCY